VTGICGLDGREEEYAANEVWRFWRRMMQLCHRPLTGRARVSPRRQNEPASSCAADWFLSHSPGCMRQMRPRQHVRRNETRCFKLKGSFLVNHQSDPIRLPADKGRHVSPAFWRACGARLPIDPLPCAAVIGSTYFEQTADWMLLKIGRSRTIAASCRWRR
jgi:hypothetical protein